MREWLLGLLFLLLALSLLLAIFAQYKLLPKVDYAEVREVPINGTLCIRLMETGPWINYTMAVCGDVVLCYNCAGVAKVDEVPLGETGVKVGQCGTNCEVYRVNGHCYSLQHVSTCK